MSKYNLIVAENPDKGISIVVDNNGGFAAYVNGKLYRTDNGRPIGHDGRQLREDSRGAIVAMMDMAASNYAAIQRERREAMEQAARNAAESARAEKPRKSFAEVLEEQFLATLTEKSAGELVNQIYPVVEKLVTERFGVLPKVHEIRLPEKPAKEVKGVLHRDFNKIVAMLADGESVYLCGPAGTGKSFMAQQLAEVLGLEYWYTSNVMDEVQLKGFIDANGRYHATQFYHAFTEGGVFLLDELDASDECAAILLNNALANGYFDFPTGRATAHKDFHCIAAGNTFGTGADSTYTGRNTIDAATLNRFAFINVNYDPAIELAMANGDQSLVNFADDFRTAVEKSGTICLCTYRDIKRLAKFSAYMPKSDAIRIGLTKGLAPDDIRTILRYMTNTSDWQKALCALAEGVK